MLGTANRLYALRSSARASLNAAARSPRAAAARRMMSSESRASHGNSSSDRPWIIGSALVFGPLFLYLVSPSARKGSHGHEGHAHQSHRSEHEGKPAQHDESYREEVAKPVVDDEGTTVSAQEIKESMEKAFEADAPKGAQEHDEVVAKAEMTTVEDKSVNDAHPNAESRTDATSITESEPNPTSAAPAASDKTSSATTDEKVQNTTSVTSEPAAGSKA